MNGLVGFASGTRTAVAFWMLWAATVSVSDAIAFSLSEPNRHTFADGYFMAFHLLPWQVWVAYLLLFGVFAAVCGLRLLLRLPVPLRFVNSVLASWGLVMCVFAVSLVESAGWPGGLTEGTKWGSAGLSAFVAGFLMSHNAALPDMIETALDWILEDYIISKRDNDHNG